MSAAFISACLLSICGSGLSVCIYGSGVSGWVVSCRWLLVYLAILLGAILGALHSLVLRTVAELVETSVGGQNDFAKPLWSSCL